MAAITCVTKDDKGNITHVGIPHTISERDAISRIQKGEEFTVTKAGKTVKVGVRTRGTSTYLSTEPDGEALNNLTNLSRC